MGGPGASGKHMDPSPLLGQADTGFAGAGRPALQRVQPALCPRAWFKASKEEDLGQG